MRFVGRRIGALYVIENKEVSKWFSLLGLCVSLLLSYIYIYIIKRVESNT